MLFCLLSPLASFILFYFTLLFNYSSYNVWFMNLIPDSFEDFPKSGQNNGIQSHSGSISWHTKWGHESFKNFGDKLIKKNTLLTR